MTSDDNVSLDRFISNFDNPEKLQADAKAALAAGEEFNKGAPIPTVSASDIRQLSEATRRLNAEIPPEPNMAIGTAVYASYGVECASEPAKFMAAQWRLTVLSDLLERGVLAAYVEGEEPDEKVFIAAATIPLTKEDIGEVMLPKILAEAPAEFVAQVREQMRAEGYDPTRPNIDAKFLRWLEDNC
ncbi:MAG TPA: hypothetical protein VL156_18085 [Terriglobales bacterium]|jgi:hypothetical protein|nr:hypothetical protein [Terriglobales bacterium]